MLKNVGSKNAFPGLTTTSGLIKLNRSLMIAFMALSLTCQTSLMAAPASSNESPKSSKFMPPIAPQLDTSYIDKSTNQAPDYSNSNPSYEYEPIPNDERESEAVKSLLRSALEKHAAGQTSQAESILQKALKTDPNNADVNYNLGAISEEKGDLKHAYIYYQKASQNNPGDGEIRDAMNAVNQKMQAEKSAVISEQQVAQLKQMAATATSAYKSGNYDLAISTLERIANQNPGDPSVYYGLGQAWRAKGNNQKARQYLAQAVQMAPDNQLYKSSLQATDSALAKSGSRGSDIASAPSTTPSPYSPSQNPYSDNYNSGSDNSPAGEITPFAPSGNSGAPRSMAESLGGSGFLSQALPFLGIGTAYALSRSGNGWGSGWGNYGSRSTGSRIKRVAAASLAGAAIGAFTGRGSSSSMKSGAMKGAMYGGLVGLITGF